jgi:RHS repeat-associated protein
VATNAKYKSTYNRYFHTDALGSITAITDDAGKVVERRSYEPFGKIRAMDYGTNNNTFSNRVVETARAFTGHEQIAELSGLIHMNARVYDSDIGRFLSADTIIQAPHDSQSYNRYSYVRNNPLMFADPSGHWWLSRLWHHIKKWVRTIVSIVVAAVIVILAGPAIAAYLGSNFLGAIATGALAGFASGGIMTGSLSGAFKGALFGAIGAGVAFGVAEVAGHLAGVGSLQAHAATLIKSGLNKLTAIKTMLHGLSRGIISKLQGGTFKAGFMSGLSSAFDIGTKAFGYGAGGFTMRTAVMAIVGGTASALGGGKFSNGAISGAFVHMFNAEYNTLGKALKGLWNKSGEIMSDAWTGLKGGLEGYREVRDNSPWYAQGMLKVGMTAVEMGLTGWIKDPVLSIWYNSTSGVVMDTYTLDPVSIATSQISQLSNYDSRWFKND